jgi:hypothetical protein
MYLEEISSDAFVRHSDTLPQVVSYRNDTRLVILVVHFGEKKGEKKMISMIRELSIDNVYEPR